MGKISKASEYVLGILVMVTLLLGVVYQIPEFGLVSWESFPFDFRTYLLAVGWVLVTASVAEAVFPGGVGRWWFAGIFAFAAYSILSAEHLPIDYPASQEAQHHWDIMPCILCIGSLQLGYKAGWYKKIMGFFKKQTC